MLYSKIRSLNVSEKFFVSCQDEFPLMFAMASLLPGTSTFKGIAILQTKKVIVLKKCRRF